MPDLHSVPQYALSCVKMFIIIVVTCAHLMGVGWGPLQCIIICDVSPNNIIFCCCNVSALPPSSLVGPPLLSCLLQDFGELLSHSSYVHHKIPLVTSSPWVTIVTQRRLVIHTYTQYILNISHKFIHCNTTLNIDGVKWSWSVLQGLLWLNIVIIGLKAIVQEQTLHLLHYMLQLYYIYSSCCHFNEDIVNIIQWPSSDFEL